MQYHGKSIDTFEYSVAMLLINNGYCLIPHADCISQRCFAFQIEDEWNRHWIVPAVDPVTAIEKLFFLTGLLEKVKIIRGKEDIFDLMPKGCLLGPVEEYSRYSVQSFYYEGETKYLYVCGKEGDSFVVHDPEGFPVRLLTKSEMQATYNLDRSIAVLLERDGKQINNFDFSEVLREGMECKRRMENWRNIETKIEHCFQGLTRGQELALNYGLYNYLLQTGKILNLMESNGNIGDRDRIQIGSMMGKMYKCVFHNCIKDFMNMKNVFFDYLDQLINMEGTR